MNKYHIVKDTREQQGYFFSNFKACAGMIDKKLDTGDYSIEGMEDVVCIERKASVEEIANNLGKKKATFMRELDRMANHKYKFIILEFSLDDLLGFPENSRIPPKQKKLIRITGKYILKCLMEFQIERDIHVIFAGDKHSAFLMLCSLFKRIHDEEMKNGRDIPRATPE